MDLTNTWINEENSKRNKILRQKFFWNKNQKVTKILVFLNFKILIWWKKIMYIQSVQCDDLIYIYIVIYTSTYEEHHKLTYPAPPMLYIGSPELINLYTKVYTLWSIFPYLPHAHILAITQFYSMFLWVWLCKILYISQIVHYLVYSFWKTLQFPKEMEIKLSYNSTFPSLGIYPNKLK